eukprot:TRINITY_DN4712_c0_g1_i4.p1 TRINITY_DN4712_c0_g1~~TRINITY_DN4712_c0_g1_i4.p1  ORF type:complete len:451 (-),score=67.73 TRINITY_DN4712_c0_g1_i4:279-1574(-)
MAEYSLGVPMVELERRLRQALRSPLKANTLRSNPGSQWLQTDKVMCPHCHKRFSSEYAKQQHLDAKSGQDGHPVTAAAESWERVQTSAAVHSCTKMEPSATVAGSLTDRVLCQHCHKRFSSEDSKQQHLDAKSGQDGHPVVAAAESLKRMQTPAAHSPATTEPLARVAAADPRSSTRGPDLAHPERDVCFVCHEGEAYFCNYQTQSSYWSKADGESATREFYTGLRQATAQNGTTFWVRGPLGGWKVDELFKQFKAQPAAPQDVNQAPHQNALSRPTWKQRGEPQNKTPTIVPEDAQVVHSLPVEPPPLQQLSTTSGPLQNEASEAPAALADWLSKCGDGRDLRKRGNRANETQPPLQHEANEAPASLADWLSKCGDGRDLRKRGERATTTQPKAAQPEHLPTTEAVASFPAMAKSEEREANYVEVRRRGE